LNFAGSPASRATTSRPRVQVMWKVGDVDILDELNPELDSVELHEAPRASQNENRTGVDVEHARVPRGDAIANLESARQVFR
jgi:hypothetical protein